MTSDILDKLAREVDKISDNAEVEMNSQENLKEVEKSTDNIGDPENISLMDQLLTQNPVVFPQIGDTITGTVIEASSNEIYLDLTPFGTGIALGKEMKDGMGAGKLKAGDEVSAIVIDCENEDGYIELSIREASYEKAWDDIESKRDTQEKINTKVLSASKGGLLVEVNGISGFLPVSQLSSNNYPRVEDGDKNKILSLLKKIVGRELEVRIIDAERTSQKLIVSEKAAQSEKDRKIISSLKVGDEITGEISGVVDFGAFVKFSSSDQKNSASEEEKLEGLVHISELAWQLIEDPRTIVKVGDKVKVKIIGIEADKISLSIRALQKDPWSEIKNKYNIGDIVKGVVHKINPFGAFVYLDKDIHGLAHISEMSEAYPGRTLDELIKIGEAYLWKILSIEPKTHRMGLVLTKEKTAKKKNQKSDDQVKQAAPKKSEKSQGAKDSQKLKKEGDGDSKGKKEKKVKSKKKESSKKS